MTHENKKQEHIRLEEYLSEHFCFRLNEITGSIEFRKKLTAEWVELNEFNIYRQLKLEGFKCNLNELIYLLKSDYVEQYNPFLSYFQGLPVWDPVNGFDHIKSLCGYVHARNATGFEKHFRKWLVRTIKCALEDHYCNKNAILLVDEVQNSGKTTFIRFLCPPSLSNYMTENISPDKDSMIALIENFMINLDELATFTRVENSALKSFMSKTFVKERHPYERKAKNLSRRASFIGSTDMPQFLTDSSGSVRWIPFELTGINWNYSKEVNIDEVWAQAYTLYKSGFACDVTAEEIKENEAENRQFTMVSAEMELLMKYHTPGSKEHHDLFLTTGEIEMNLRKETNGLVKISNNQLGKALRMLGFERGNRYSKSKEYPIKAYYLKFRNET